MNSPESGLQVVGEICSKPAAGPLSVVARVRHFFADSEGAALIEYGLLVLLLAALCIFVLQTIGSKVSNGFNSANAALP